MSRQRAAGSRQQAAGSRQQAEGGRQQAEGGRWKVEGGRQEAAGIAAGGAGNACHACSPCWPVAASQQLHGQDAILDTRCLNPSPFQLGESVEAAGIFGEELTLFLQGTGGHHGTKRFDPAPVART